jgi:hypothetical protein
MQAEMAPPSAISRPITQSHAASTRSIRGWPRRLGWRPSRGLLLAAAAAALLAGTIAVLAVHGRQWRWTGFEGNTSLWAWLQTFAQPLAFVSLTVRLTASAQG